MKYLLVAMALLFGGISIPVVPAGASDLAVTRTSAPASAWPHGQYRPFPRSERARSVRASGACWSECGSYCVWGLVGCLAQDAQGVCLTFTDSCDRYCQRQCRTSGGPWVAPLLGILD